MAKKIRRTRNRSKTHQTKRPRVKRSTKKRSKRRTKRRTKKQNGGSWWDQLINGTSSAQPQPQQPEYDTCDQCNVQVDKRNSHRELIYDDTDVLCYECCSKKDSCLSARSLVIANAKEKGNTLPPPHTQWKGPGSIYAKLNESHSVARAIGM